MRGCRVVWKTGGCMVAGLVPSVQQLLHSSYSLHLTPWAGEDRISVHATEATSSQMVSAACIHADGW